MKAPRFRPRLEECEARDVPAQFLVNSDADLPDNNVGDGIAWTGQMLKGQQEVTLRAAIMELNASGPGPHQIYFSIPPRGRQIALTSALPEIQVSMAIEGGPGNKDRVIITRDTTTTGYTFFTVATGATTPKNIQVFFRDLTITDAIGALGDHGGAINNDAITHLQNVDLINNRAAHGGAIKNSRQMVILNCSLENNSTQGEGGEGGALWGVSDNSLTVITNTLFYANTATNAKGGAISLNHDARMQITDSVFLLNSGAQGGAIYSSVGHATQASLTIYGSYFGGNTSTAGGGAIFTSTTHTYVENTTFSANSSNFAGAFFARNCEVTFADCTFQNNTASGYGDTLVYAGIPGTLVWITLINCTGLTYDDFEEYIPPNP